MLIQMDARKREMCLFIYKMLSLPATRIWMCLAAAPSAAPPAQWPGARPQRVALSSARGSSEQGVRSEPLLCLTFLPASGAVLGTP